MDMILLKNEYFSIIGDYHIMFKMIITMLVTFTMLSI
jgi:hypothetical protein